MNLNYFTFALATAITLSSFLFNLLLLVRAEEDQSWGPKQRQIAVKDDSALVTINHVRFRDLRTGLMYGQYGTVHSTISTITGCAAACMDDGGCVNWVFSDNNQCYSFGYALRSRPRKTYWGYWGKTFEIMVKSFNFSRRESFHFLFHFPGSSSIQTVSRIIMSRNISKSWRKLLKLSSVAGRVDGSRGIYQQTVIMALLFPLIVALL